MKPQRIFIIRHGESLANVDINVLKTIPDYAIRLTDRGVEQAKIVGQNIKSIIKQFNLPTYCAYYSPYFRARATMEHAINEMDKDFCLFTKEDYRLREQEYRPSLHPDLDYNDEDDKHRNEFGKFFYRKFGESGAMVCDRAADVVGTLHRDFENNDYPNNVLIFTHGMFTRCFVHRWFKHTVDEFETWKNPRNGEIWIMELQSDNKYKLITEIRKHEKGWGVQY